MWGFAPRGPGPRGKAAACAQGSHPGCKMGEWWGGEQGLILRDPEAKNQGKKEMGLANSLEVEVGERDSPIERALVTGRVKPHKASLSHLGTGKTRTGEPSVLGGLAHLPTQVEGGTSPGSLKLWSEIVNQWGVGMGGEGWQCLTS